MFHFDYPAFLIYNFYTNESLLEKIEAAKASNSEALGISKIHKVLEKILFSYFKTSGLDSFFYAVRRKAQTQQQVKKEKLLLLQPDNQPEIETFFKQYITNYDRAFLMEIDEYLYKFAKELFHTPSHKFWTYITHKVHAELTSFIGTLISSGKRCLQEEHVSTLKKIASLGDFQLVDFDYYFNIRYDSYDKKPDKTIQDFYGYLSYLEEFAITKKNEATSGFTQSQEKAQDLLNATHKIRGELDHIENELLEGECKRMAALQAMLIQLQFGEHIHPSHRDYIDKQTRELKEGSSLWQSSPFRDEDGKFQLDDATANLLKKELNYWNKELLYSEGRLMDVSSIKEFIAEPHDKRQNLDMMFRYIHKNESQDIKTHLRISQHNKNSFERSKWFFYGKAQVGNNVEHEFLCQIHLKPGTLNLLLSLAKTGSTTDAIIAKENEKDCIGIHEDVLPFFNQLIQSVTLSTKKNPEKKDIIQFPSDQIPDESVNDSEEIGSPSHGLRFYRYGF